MNKKILLLSSLLTIFFIGLFVFMASIPQPITPLSEQTETFTSNLRSDEPTPPAISLTKKTINGTEFTLLSNTDHCLSNCEAWIEWDLTKGILTDTQIPSIPNEEFNFNLEKETTKTEDLKNFGIEVWEEKGTIIQDYNIITEQYIKNITPLDLNGERDLNGESLTCEEIACETIDKSNCRCTRTIQEPSGTHIEYNWEKVSNNFYGFEAKAGKIYRLRVWGNKKAKLGSNDIDWIPTFFGEEITLWAWWNSFWNFKQKTTLDTSSVLSNDITNDHAILVIITSTNSDFWDNVDSTGKDVRFINLAEDEEYNFHFEKFDSDNDIMIAWVEVTDTFTSASDLEVYIYYGNESAEDAQNINGTYSESYTAVYHMETTSTPQNDSTSNSYDLTLVNTPTQEAGKINGSLSFASGSSEYAWQNGSLGNATATKLSWSMWMNFPDGWSSAESSNETFIHISGTTFGMWGLPNGQIDGYLNGIQIKTQKVSYDADTWYHFVVTYDSTIGGGSDELNIYVNGDKATLGNTSTGSYNTIPQNLNPLNLARNVSGVEYFDGGLDEVKFFFGTFLSEDEVKLIYNSESGNLVTFAPQETLITDSCSCPSSGNWEIINGDICTLSTECNLSSGSLYIISGSLNISSTGTLKIPSGEKIIIQKDNNLYRENGAILVIDK